MVCGGTRCACWLKKDSVMALNLKAGVNLRVAKVQFLWSLYFTRQWRFSWELRRLPGERGKAWFGLNAV